MVAVFRFRLDYMQLCIIKNRIAALEAFYMKYNVRSLDICNGFSIKNLNHVARKEFS